MVATPLVGLRTVHRMRIVVVLPAPLGPSRPKTSPGWASKLTPSTASTWPRRRSRNDFVRFSTWIMDAFSPADGFARESILHGTHRGRLIHILVEHVALPGDVTGLADGGLDLLQRQVMHRAGRGDDVLLDHQASHVVGAEEQ